MDGNKICPENRLFFFLVLDREKKNIVELKASLAAHKHVILPVDVLKKSLIFISLRK